MKHVMTWSEMIGWAGLMWQSDLLAYTNTVNSLGVVPTGGEDRISGVHAVHTLQR